MKLSKNLSLFFGSVLLGQGFLLEGVKAAPGDIKCNIEFEDVYLKNNPDLDMRVSIQAFNKTNKEVTTKEVPLTTGTKFTLLVKNPTERAAELQKQFKVCDENWVKLDKLREEAEKKEQEKYKYKDKENEKEMTFEEEAEAEQKVNEMNKLNFQCYQLMTESIKRCEFLDPAGRHTGMDKDPKVMCNRWAHPNRPDLYSAGVTEPQTRNNLHEAFQTLMSMKARDLGKSATEIQLHFLSRNWGGWTKGDEFIVTSIPLSATVGDAYTYRGLVDDEALWQDNKYKVKISCADEE